MSETTNDETFQTQGYTYYRNTLANGDVLWSRDIANGYGSLPLESVDEELEYALDALAAARREVETVTRERNEARLFAQSDAKAWADCMTELKAARKALATSRAALEDVRRVEAWLEEYPDGRYVDASKGVFRMVDVRRGDDEDVPAESIAALGRALAQEAGDAAK